MMPFPLLIHNISGIITITISKITTPPPALLQLVSSPPPPPLSMMTMIMMITITLMIMMITIICPGSCHLARTAAIHPTCRVGAGSPTHPAQSTYKHTNDECDCEDKYKHIKTQTKKKRVTHSPSTINIQTYKRRM